MLFTLVPTDRVVSKSGKAVGLLMIIASIKVDSALLRDENYLKKNDLL
jgi:hypothetical protein